MYSDLDKCSVLKCDARTRLDIVGERESRNEAWYSEQKLIPARPAVVMNVFRVHQVLAITLLSVLILIILTEHDCCG